MGGVITTGNLARLLQDGVANVFGTAYEKHQKEWNLLFEGNDSVILHRQQWTAQCL